jgi:hypothetical protein
LAIALGQGPSRVIGKGQISNSNSECRVVGKKPGTATPIPRGQIRADPGEAGRGGEEPNGLARGRDTNLIDEEGRRRNEKNDWVKLIAIDPFTPDPAFLLLPAAVMVH